MQYDNVNLLRRDFMMGEAGGAATTTYAKFRTFAHMRLKRVHAVVTTAGTTTAHAFDVYHGTNSIGTIACGTSTAGVVAVSPVLNKDVPSLEQISVKSKADLTGRAEIVYEYEFLSDSVLS